MKLITTFVLVTAIVVTGYQAFSEDGDCSLWVERGQLCIARRKAANECQRLDPNKVEGTEQFRCLSRALNSTRHCERITIAQNTFVILRPFKVRYGAIWFRQGRSKALYSEESIESSCRW